MSTLTVEPSSRSSTDPVSPTAEATGHPTDKLRAYLNAYWLRPENAMWMTLRSDALACSSRSGYDLDLGCGDGVFSFIHGGGRLEPAFDVFHSVELAGDTHGKRLDMFDHIDERYHPIVSRDPNRAIRTGTDLKPTLLAKACRLNVYEELLQHDLNEPLPFPDESFETVHCNMAYWVCNVDGLLGEMRRITVSGGRILLHVKLDAIRDCTLAKHAADLGPKFLDIIGRDRFDSWPTLADPSTWEHRFHRAGLQIEQAIALATTTHAHLWDVGLRPIAPLLIRMANGLDPAERASIKSDWVELFHTLAEPLCDRDLDLGSRKGEPVEMQYELSPS